MKKEWIARGLAVLLLILSVAIPVAATLAAADDSPGDRISVHARMAEDGGWMPNVIIAEAGRPMRLRLTSDDVLHGFAVGQIDQPAVDVKPGEVTEITLTFDRAGTYTFYCTRWCGPNHWRMRGVIEVVGPAAAAEIALPPLYVRLGIDIDAPHFSDVVPEQNPSAVRGALLEISIPASFWTREYYLAHSPAALWHALRDDPAEKSLSDQDVWDLVALVWQSNTTPEKLAEGRDLFKKFAAAAHGVQGDGRGVLLGTPTPDPASGNPAQSPADFTDPRRMLGASPALLQGKIIRGGMGTGMPSFGAVFTEEQTWSLVDYLWTFQFEYAQPYEVNHGS